MRKVINALLIVDIGIIIFCFLSGERVWLINSQIGFITSSLVMFASIISYRNMVQHRVDAGFVIGEDNRDTIEKIEDPYDLYNEEGRSGCPQPDDNEKKSMQEIVQEEKENLKRNRRSIWQVTKDSKAALSFYRLGAYGMLILGFFYLNNNKILEISPYLFTLLLPPVIIVTILMSKK